MKRFIAIAIAFACLNIEAFAQSGWFSQSSGIGNRLYSVHFADSRTGWAVGSEGTIIKTINGGTNWILHSSGTNNYLYSVHFADSRTGWAVGSEGTIIKTTNGGTNWILQSSGTNHLLCSVHFTNKSTCWAVGNAGTILKTTNGGTNWTAQTSGASNGLRSVHFVDNSTGWVVGDEGTILKTTNGGSNWTRQTGTGFWLRSVQFFDNNIGWTVGEWSNILKTTNGGTNWITQLSGTGDWLRSVHFIDNSTGWTVGEHSIILRTTNGGANWISQTSGTIQWLLSVYFASNNTGWAVGDFGTILKTTTGGIWYPQICLITGADTVYPGPDALFVSDRTPGTWSLDNSGETNALIVSDPDNDSVYVNPGSENGQFTLEYRSSDSSYCSKAVRVIAPVYLNYSCNYQSGHLFADTRFGYSVNSAGDFNGDGFDDLVMGTPWTGGSLCWAGIYYGPPSGGAGLDIQFFGEIPYFGSSVSHAGDVNADGYDDVVIGSYGNQNTRGRAYVYLGNFSGILNHIVLEGEENGDGFGYSVCKAGDVNMDGFDDIIIGSGNEKAFIYFGGQQMNNVPDVILESESPYSAFGRSVSYAGDVNGDGFSDVVVGAHSYLNNIGRAYVYFGGRQMDNVPDVIMTGEMNDDLHFGSHVGSAGDIDNDGFKDIVIGEGNDQHSVFRAQIFKGSQSMDNVPDLTINTLTNDESFASVFLNDDFNGDSYSDVLVGAPLYSSNEGRAYMYLGSSNMDNSPDYIMNSNGGGKFGFSASVAGDLNADGYLDAIIGAPTWGPEEWGSAYVYNGFGDPNRTLAELTLSTSPFSVSMEGYTFDAAATVKNLYNQPLSGVRVNFFRRGINNSYFNSITDMSGTAPFQLGSNSPGTDKLISVSGRYSDTSLIIWTSSDLCIAGPLNVLKNTTNLYVYEHQSNVRFELLNDTSAKARIVSDSNNDSVYIESGNAEGRFAVSVLSGDEVLCTHVAHVDTPYPVHVAALTSYVKGKSVVLKWSTSVELNNYGFEIERTSANAEWKKIGFVSGNGTTNEPKDYSFTDTDLETGIYSYRLKQIDFNGNFEYFELPEAVTVGVPDKFFVDQNYPNPFNPVTTIAYGIPQSGNVVLKIFDMAGREVKSLVNEFKDAGYYVAKFDGSSLASGTYIYRIESGSFVSAKKMVLLK